MTATVVLKGEEREIALAELGAVRAAVTDGDYGQTLDTVLEGLEDAGTLSEDGAAEVDRVLTLALQTGRVRALHGPGGEQAALKAFRRLPTGVELARTASEVSEALTALRGRTLDGVQVAVNGPGAFSVTLVADGTEVVLRLDKSGARVASVAP